MGSLLSPDRTKPPFLPVLPYRPSFYKNEAPPLSVIKELKHYDNKQIENSIVPIVEFEGEELEEEKYKVFGCAFCPYDDNILLTIATFRTESSYKVGFIQIWDLEEGKHSNILFTNSPNPPCVFSPDGELITAVIKHGRDTLNIVELFVSEDDELELDACALKCRGYITLTGRTVCCFFAPDGKSVITVANVTLHSLEGNESHELTLWKVLKYGDQKILQNVWSMCCEILCPNFAGKLQCCQISADGEFIAVTTTEGQLYVIKSDTFELFCMDSHGYRNDTLASNPCHALFDPRYSHKRLLACYKLGQLRSFEINETLEFVDCVDIVRAPRKINAFAMSADGSLLAVALSDARVIVKDSDEFVSMYTLSPWSYSWFNENVTCLAVSFSRSCEELAVGYNDGYARIWQLPVRINLQDMCRRVILQYCSPDRVRDLPLPSALKLYLVYSYIPQIQLETLGLRSILDVDDF